MRPSPGIVLGIFLGLVAPYSAQAQETWTWEVTPQLGYYRSVGAVSYTHLTLPTN